MMHTPGSHFFGLPHRIRVTNENGAYRYTYLLKSQEDLRVDERVMAFSRLVNSFLGVSGKRRILRYSVTPLAERSGLIGWVDNCELLHSLMVQSRKRKNVVLHAEHMYIRQMAPQTFDAERKGTDDGYDKLQLRQKVEVFEAALAKTDGDDLADMLWRSSPNAETWISRRTTYVLCLSLSAARCMGWWPPAFGLLLIVSSRPFSLCGGGVLGIQCHSQ